MAENLQPESMSTWMRGIEKRLVAVERPSRLSTVQYTSIVAPNTFTQATNTAYTVMWEFNLSLVVADAVSVAAVVNTNPGATLNLRLKANTSGTPTTAVLAFPANTQDVVRFDWLVPNLDIGLTGVYIQLEAQHTNGGVGNAGVYVPIIAMQVPSYEVDAAADGNPRIV